MRDFRQEFHSMVLILTLTLTLTQTLLRLCPPPLLPSLGYHVCAIWNFEEQISFFLSGNFSHVRGARSVLVYVVFFL